MTCGELKEFCINCMSWVGLVSCACQMLSFDPDYIASVDGAEEMQCDEIQLLSARFQL